MNNPRKYQHSYDLTHIVKTLENPKNCVEYMHLFRNGDAYKIWDQPHNAHWSFGISNLPGNLGAENKLAYQPSKIKELIKKIAATFYQEELIYSI
jgi:hypothetical protein